jgi:hypothetical protein
VCYSPRAPPTRRTGEFVDIKSVIFLTVSVVLALALTSTERTSGTIKYYYTILYYDNTTEYANSIVLV